MSTILFFFQTLLNRNTTLFYFGMACLVLSVVFLLLSATTTTQVNNVSAWIKPFKFAFSTLLYSWTMAWFIWYLPKFNSSLFAWSTVVLLGFEIVYIAVQASRGQLSHYNTSTPFYSALFSLMALAATLITVYTAYIGVLFFTTDSLNIPIHYLWSIRLGIIIFVIFSFEGFVMGANLSHSIGGKDGGSGIPLLHWSTKFGDPRVSHFIGMHALQVLPLLSFYILRNTKATITVGLLYLLLAVFTLVQAFNGKPFVKL